MTTASFRHPCRVCAVWECATCRWRRRPANRLRPDLQYCSRCGSEKGEFKDVMHTALYIQREHDEDADRELGPVS
jgi:hypothetical protein